jgi:hypothetical protein
LRQWFRSLTEFILSVSRRVRGDNRFTCHSAREEVKGKIARTAMIHLGRLHRIAKFENPQDCAAVERLWQHYDTYLHMGAGTFAFSAR